MILLAQRGSVGLGACPVLTLLGKRSGLAFGFFILRKREREARGLIVCLPLLDC